MIPMRKYLSDFFKLEDQEFFNYADEIEGELYDGLKKEFIKKSRDFSDKAVELFKKDFWFEPDGTQRNWNKIKDDDIDAMFKASRLKYLDMFESLKHFKLLKSPLKGI
jgi:hypothetical protein